MKWDSSATFSLGMSALSVLSFNNFCLEEKFVREHLQSSILNAMECPSRVLQMKERIGT